VKTHCLFWHFSQFSHECLVHLFRRSLKEPSASGEEEGVAGEDGRRRGVVDKEADVTGRVTGGKVALDVQVANLK
jgi:hypothetical protein